MDKRPRSPSIPPPAHVLAANAADPGDGPEGSAPSGGASGAAPPVLAPKSRGSDPIDPATVFGILNTMTPGSPESQNALMMIMRYMEMHGVTATAPAAHPPPVGQFFSKNVYRCFTI